MLIQLVHENALFIWSHLRCLSTGWGGGVYSVPLVCISLYMCELWNHCSVNIAVQTLLRSHCCGIIAVDSLVWKHCCGIIACGIIAVESLLWNHRCGITEWEASGGHLGGSRGVTKYCK